MYIERPAGGWRALMETVEWILTDGQTSRVLAVYAAGLEALAFLVGAGIEAESERLPTLADVADLEASETEGVAGLALQLSAIMVRSRGK